MRVINLGGRFFAPATETTARQDGWMIVQCTDAGVADFIGKKLDEKTALSFIVQLIRSGKREMILAGALVEQGEKWTPESATANAEYFANLTDPASKAALGEALIPVLTGFFPTALLSSMGSQSASVETARALEPKKPGKRSTKSAAPAQAGIGAA